MPVLGNLRGKKLNSGSTVVSSEVKLMCSIAGWRYGDAVSGTVDVSPSEVMAAYREVE